MRVSAPGQKIFSGEIILPASKSISNRVLIIKALSRGFFKIHNLSGASDTIQLDKILSENANVVDAGDGGTTLRFLLAYFAIRESETILTASGSMKLRPVAPLVVALREMGASIEYLEEEGKLPVKITGAALSANSVKIDGDISSQFISALMMIAPYIKGGLNIEIRNEILSLPYIHMTLAVMKYFGCETDFKENRISIPEGKYIERDITIERDWSAASYWYETAALSDECELVLTGLVKDSLQGDAVIVDMMEQLGVQTKFTGTGAILSRISNFIPPDYFTADFSGCPDLAPAVASVCAALNITADLTGLKNFRLKESDRASAMQRELYNLNVKTDFCGGSKFKIYSGRGMKAWTKPIHTYNDHRIAMAFAPLALKTGVIQIDNPAVVNKSYPGYFEELGKFLIVGE